MFQCEQLTEVEMYCMKLHGGEKRERKKKKKTIHYDIVKNGLVFGLVAKLNTHGKDVNIKGS